MLVSRAQPCAQPALTKTGFALLGRTLLSSVSRANNKQGVVMERSRERVFTAKGTACTKALGVLEEELDGQCGWRGRTLPGGLEMKWEGQAGRPVHGGESDGILYAMGGQERVLTRVGLLSMFTHLLHQITF